MSEPRPAVSAPPGAAPARPPILPPEVVARIEAAVGRVELASGAEVRVVVAARVDGHEGALWKGATAGALLAAGVATALFVLQGGWGLRLALWIGLPAVAGAAVGYLAALLVPALRRALAGAALLDARVEARAAAAFLAESVFATRDRTGVLVFVALFERRLVILGDEGIHRHVGRDAWPPIVARAAERLRRGEIEAALVGAVEDCGALVAGRVVRRDDDRDELSDAVRLEDR